MSGPRSAAEGAPSGAAPPSRPRAGLVIPTFRRPHFLRSALASAVGQTERDIEILVCDNGGDEETAAVVASFADDRIRHIVRDTDVGMRANAVDGFPAGGRRRRAQARLAWLPGSVARPILRRRATPAGSTGGCVGAVPDDARSQRRPA